MTVNYEHKNVLEAKPPSSLAFVRFLIFFFQPVLLLSHIFVHIFFYIVLFVTSIPCTLSFCYNYITVLGNGTKCYC